jgi:hypothetical protein
MTSKKSKGNTYSAAYQAKHDEERKRWQSQEFSARRLV